MGRRLLLARHCQSEYNAAGLLTGWANPDLTAEGERDAYRLGVALRDLEEPISAVFTSSLKRASQTARIACLALDRDNPPVVETELLWERSVGILTGLSKADVDNDSASSFHAWRTCFFSAPPEGESLAQVSQRVATYITETVVPSVPAEGCALIVAHHNTIKAFLIAVSRSWVPAKIGNGSLIEFCIESGNVRDITSSATYANAA